MKDRGNPNPDAVCLIHEVNRINHGGAPHAPESPEAQAINRALHRCTQVPDLVALAAVARRVFAAAVAELKTRPLHEPFEKPHRGPARPGKTTE